ncbi:MAG: hypothetical protein JST66_01910 [Bacteroidetes bacterium]|nr:hypothetical protein [Bacteroidota bacterium]
MRHALLLAFFALTACARAQTAPAADSTLTRYQPGFPFREGLYFTFAAFRDNAPTVPKDRLTTDQGQRITDLRTTNGKVFYPDSTGERKRLDLDRLWGFCDNGVVYVRAGNGFSRIGLMGSISHLTFDATYRDWGGYGMYGSTTYTVEEQRFLDMDSGAFLPVTAGGIYPVIARDAVLKEAFDALPKKERNKQGTAFLFMRRYNDRHPLYFPR